MKDFAYTFYHSQAWRREREHIIKTRFGLCERCMANGEFIKGTIVHHKIHLTPENIGDKNITLSESNLELLCRDCHALEHAGEIKAGISAKERKRTFGRYVIDADGNVRTTADE